MARGVRRRKVGRMGTSADNLSQQLEEYVMRVVNYLRASTDDHHGQSAAVGAQRERLANYCRHWGHEIVEIVVDDEWSGKRLDRPGLRRALAMLKVGTVDGLAVCNLDRLTQSIGD